MNNNKKGFTLAEVLITLTIIGVVAALTIPSLLANVNDKTYESKRKGLATRLSQAISQLDALNSYEAKIPDNYTGSESATEYAKKNSSTNFITEGLSKVYKITNICAYENYTACDYPTEERKFWESGSYSPAQFKDFNSLSQFTGDTQQNYLNTIPAAFRTRNGESILLYYNPRCIAEQEPNSDGEKSWITEVCLVMRIDLDGAKKGPNQLGKDISYMAVLYPDTPFLVYFNGVFQNSGTEENFSDTLVTAEEMTAYGFSKGVYTVPTKEQAALILLSIDFTDSNNYWTSSIEGSGNEDYAWQIIMKENKLKLVQRSAMGKRLLVMKEHKM